MRTKILYTTVLFLVTVYCYEARSGQVDCSKLPLTVEARIIGYDQILPFGLITTAPKSQILILNVERLVAGKEQSPYLVVVYRFGLAESALPDKVLEGNETWKFTLNTNVLDKSCDDVQLNDSTAVPETEKNEINLPRWKFISEASRPPLNARLPCYVMDPQDFHAK